MRGKRHRLLTYPRALLQSLSAHDAMGDSVSGLDGEFPPPQKKVFLVSHIISPMGVLEETKEIKGHSSLLLEAITIIEKTYTCDTRERHKDTHCHMLCFGSSVVARCSQSPRKHGQTGDDFL